MNKRKLKAIIGVAMVTCLSINSMSYATTKNESEYSKLINSINKNNLVQTSSSTSNTDGVVFDNSRISSDIDTNSDEMVSVIVEFVSEPLAVSDGTSLFNNDEAKVQRDHRVFETFLSNAPQTYSEESLRVTQSYYTVYNGVAMDIKASDIEWLLNCKVVKKIHKDEEVKVDTLNNDDIAEDNVNEVSSEEAVSSNDTEAVDNTQNTENVEAIENTEVNNDNVNIENEDIENVDSTEVQYIDDVNTNEIELFMMDSIPFLDIDDLHEEGLTGKGIKVGVLDTGIDYNHPDLTDSYNGFRAGDGDANNQDIDTVKGWDFVDNDADPMETTYSDWKVSGEAEFDDYGTPYYTSHGTHVSGTIAGQGENEESENSVLGVAPNVELYGYRVLGARGSGMTSSILAAVEKSVNDGMDVINMSLGATGSDPFSPLCTAVNNATLAGVVTVIASGNSGPDAGSVGTPSTAQLPIAVGASNVDFDYDTYSLKLADSEVNSQVMAKDLEGSFSVFEGKELEYVYCGLGYVDDFNGIDVNGKVALIDRGDITFKEKIKNAKDAGAVFVILANNITDSDMPYLGEIPYLNTLAVSLEDGQALKDSKNKSIKIESTGSYTVKGDKLTDFSSVGPVKSTYEIRPDVVAPGYQVFSTVPEYINDKNEDEENYNIAYERMSGTSMATPHVAGIAALILEANPDYTPEDVKAALMNTSEKITKEDGSDYSVNQIGAGRVNPYEAVHEEVSFKAEYEVIAGEDGTKYNNVTGMLSFGKLYKSKENPTTIEKSIPVTVTNNSDVEKTYNVSVVYSNSDRALSAEANNVKVDVVDTITVAPGESEKMDAKVVIAAEANIGSYEGYVYFTDASDSNNTYQMPFSTTVSIEGFSTLYYPTMMGDVSQGLTAFNTSASFNKSSKTYYTGSDITFTMSVSEPISTVHTFIKDKTTGEYIGHAGSQDTSWVPEDLEVLIANVMPGGIVSKIVDGNVTEEKIPMENGLYDLEIVAETYTGRSFVETLPVAVINDTNSDTLTFSLDEGIIEVSDDLFSTEVWYDGEEHEGIWLRANVFNEYVDKMKNECGLDYLKQEELNAVYAMGYYPNGERLGMDTMGKPDGEVVIAGVERSDLEDGFFKVVLDYVNVGTITDKPHNFIFVNKDTQYLGLDTNLERVTEGDDLNATISLNNVKDITEGNFVISNSGDAILNIESITPSKELKSLLDKNNASIDINFEEVEVEYSGQEFNISFTIEGGSEFSLNDDIELFDINYKVKEFRGATEDLVDDDQYRYMNLSGISGEFKDSNGDIVDVKAATMDKNLTIESTERTLIYGQTKGYARNMTEANVYAIDPDGNKYEPTYFKFDEMGERGHLFAFNNLPVIDGDYKVVLETPGGFDSVMNVAGSKVNADNEMVGNIFGITSYSFTTSTPMQSVLGDVNEDGAIDILDAMEVGKLYEPTVFDEFGRSTEVASEKVAADLTQDGIVNFNDMAAVLENYLRKDYLREDAKEPQEVYNGNDIYDVLEDCGYFDEQPDMNVTLDVDKYELKAGETLNLTATPPAEGVEFEYEFAVRGENDSEWTVIRDRDGSNLASWTPEEAGTYGVKVRIFFDDINYIWQDNKVVTVSQSDDTEEPGNGGDNGSDGDNGDNGNGNDGDKPTNPGDGDGNGDGNGSEDGTKPSVPSNPEGDKVTDSNKGDLPKTGGTNAMMTLMLGAITSIGGVFMSKKRK